MSSANPFTGYAKTNFSLSGASGLYDRARPRYPPAALEQIVSYLPKNANLVELGSGTGIFSRALLKTAEDAGKLGQLTAVEPAEGMRKGFQDKLFDEGVPASVKGKVEVVDGTFEKIPLGDASADLVVAAQAFHWIGHDGQRPVTEIARVLKPGGKLALIWNLEDRDKATWIGELRDLYEKFEAGTPQYRLGYWKSIFDLPDYSKKFAPPQRTDFPQTIIGTEQTVVDRVLSKSYITALSDEEKSSLEAKVRAVVQKGNGKVWIEEKEGTFEYPYETNLYVIERL